MGWLGWTEQQTLDTSMPAIQAAYETRRDMYRQLVGAMWGVDTSSDEPPPEKPSKPSPAAIMNVFRMAAGGRR